MINHNYKVICPECWCDAGVHTGGKAQVGETVPLDKNGHHCWRTAAELYADECERLMIMIKEISEQGFNTLAEELGEQVNKMNKLTKGIKHKKNR